MKTVSIFFDSHSLKKKKKKEFPQIKREYSNFLKTLTGSKYSFSLISDYIWL